MVPNEASHQLVGRQSEVELLRALVREVSSGRGRCVLVEGEPGIGKSTVMSAGMAEAASLGCLLVWGSADELSQRLPLRVMCGCLDIDRWSVDPYRGEIAAMLLGERPAGLLGSGDPVHAATEMVVALVERWCAGSPMVLVVDDLQWADEASLLAWRQLAEMTEQMPLLLVGAYRPVPKRAPVVDLGEAVRSHKGVIVALEPLANSDVHEMVADLVGRSPGPALRRMAGRAAGNPMYLRELVDVLLREEAVVVQAGEADLATAAPSLPASLSAAVSRRLGFLSRDVTQILQATALLGVECPVAHVAAVLGQTERDLAPQFDEAVAARVVTRAGDRLRFRHPLIRLALYEAMPTALRAGLHRHAAQALAEAGAPLADVAEQLTATPAAMDGWVLDWLAGHASALVNRAPQIAVELLQRAVALAPPNGPWWDTLSATPAVVPWWDTLSATLAVVLFRLGRTAEAETSARAVLYRTADRGRKAHMRWILAYSLLRSGRAAEAAAELRQALDDPELPETWHARLLALAAMMQAGTAGDVDAAEAAARRALAIGEAAGDRFAIGCALQALSVVSGVRRDEPARLACIDRALEVLDDDAEYTDLRLLHLANRLYSLTVLDRFAEAEVTLATVRTLAERMGDARLASLHHPAATHYFLVGRWDDALVELDAIAQVPEDQAYTGMVHGLAALVAIRRDDRATAERHLTAAADQPANTPTSRANSMPLLTARSVSAERAGRTADALAVLVVLLDPGYAHTERHLLLPDLVRLAVALDDVDTARAAAETCAADAARVPTPGRQAAADRCRGMLSGDPGPVLDAAGHYRRVGRRPELGQALEDAAVLLARRGDIEAARAAFGEALEVYDTLGVARDIRRAAARLRPYGIMRGSRAARPRGRHGWDALTPTERLVADLVADGRSNPDIAAHLLLSRRTVQAHVSHILDKLEVHSRIEIARTVASHRAEDIAVGAP